jgi:transcriptional regulator of acetoin/glycerol metabolism
LSRLDGFTYRLRPLRERMEDLGACVATIFSRHRGTIDEATCFSPDVVDRMLAYRWPSNIRELQQCILRCCTLADGRVVKLHHLPDAVADGPVAAPVGRQPPPAPGRWSERDSRTRRRLIALLAKHDGNITEVAKALGKARMQVQRWLKRFDIDAHAFRSEE